jgi:ATP synthase protein I
MAKKDEGEITRKSGIMYAAVLALVFSIVSMLVVGWLLDRWLGTGPWLVVAGIVLGAVAGFYEFIRLVSKIS